MKNLPVRLAVFPVLATSSHGVWASRSPQIRQVVFERALRARQFDKTRRGTAD